MPTSPWFYIFLSAGISHSLYANGTFIATIGADLCATKWLYFIRMRLYNFATRGYAGEAYLAFWGRNNLQPPIGQVAAAEKDSDNLSGLAANTFTLALLAIFFASSQLAIPQPGKTTTYIVQRLLSPALYSYPLLLNTMVKYQSSSLKSQSVFFDTFTAAHNNFSITNLAIGGHVFSSCCRNLAADTYRPGDADPHTLFTKFRRHSYGLKH